MKKSYDYFKTLKNLSDILFESFKSCYDYKVINKEYLCFSALKNELSENLINEFVAPIDRNDIFRLSFCLNEEFEFVINLCQFLNLSHAFSFEFLGQIGNLFNKQAEIFDLKALLKMPERTIQTISSLNSECKSVKKSIIAETRSIICSQNQPLINYVIASSGIDVISSIERTCGEISRVLINNN